MTLIDPLTLQKILERGLLNGWWSVEDFNRQVTRPTFPSVEFLYQHQRFREYEFRDMAAYANSSAYNRSRGII